MTMTKEALAPSGSGDRLLGNPAGRQIAAALNALNDGDRESMIAAAREFRLVGDVCVGMIKFPSGMTDMEKGYLLGLEAARVVATEEAMKA